MRETELALRLAAEVAREGGRVYYVGGFVRDRRMGVETKDIDVEVYGIAPARLRQILSALGDVLEKGASFGVLTLRHTNLDVAMPRRESRTGERHTDFDVRVDPYLSTREASRRRDFTINAMLMDVLTGEVLDPWGGLRDLEAGVLRHVAADTFPEDALRVFRAAQFAARFGFALAPETVELCRGMDVRALSRERVFEEMCKALLKAEQPSVFFDVLEKTDHLPEFFPEIDALRGVAQNPRYHPEGDVYRHTMLVLDQAAKLRPRAKEPLFFMLAALCHDLGKANATRVEADGRITSHMHAVTGQPLAERQMRRLTDNARLIRYVTDMVANHMRPNAMAMSNSKKKKTRLLFDASVCPEDLILLAHADAAGTHGQPYDERQERFLLERLEDWREAAAMPMVTGRDLIDAGLAPGEDFQEMLARARELRFAGITRENALKQILAENAQKAALSAARKSAEAPKIKTKVCSEKRKQTEV